MKPEELPHLELSIDSKVRHERFIQRVLASGAVWGLKSADGWVMSRSTAEATSGRGIMPFWSDRAYAKQCANNNWAKHVPTEIPLDIFLERWMPGMDADGLLVGTNWSAHLCGYEIEPLNLRDEMVAARSGGAVATRRKSNPIVKSSAAKRRPRRKP